MRLLYGIVVPIQKDAVPRHVRAIGIINFGLPKRPRTNARPQVTIATAVHSSIVRNLPVPGKCAEYRPAGSQSKPARVVIPRAVTLNLFRQFLRSCAVALSANHHAVPHAKGVRIMNASRTSITGSILA